MIQIAKRLNTIEEYYFSSKLREVKELIANGQSIVNMGIGSPDLKPSQKVTDALINGMLDENAHQYQSYQGLPELRAAMANFYKANFNVDLNPISEILPLMGSKEGILPISLAFLNEGDKVLIPNPGYPTYQSVANIVGAKTILYDLVEDNNWEPDFDALEKTDLTKVKIMWVNYPNMPTGSKGNLDLFKKLIAFAKKNKILLINDNPYSFILNDQPTSILSIEGAKEVAIELNSLSKTFNMAGWRIGWVSGNEKFINAILKVKSNMDSGMFYGVQKGAIEALNLKEDWFKTQDEIYHKRRILVYQLADLLQCKYEKDAVGLFVWAKIPDSAISSIEFVNDLLHKNDLFIAPGSIFGNKGDRFVRFSLCIPEEKITALIAKIKLKRLN